MVFWIGILVAGTFAWFSIKLGFFETWAIFFNIIISIYLAIYLQPVIVNVPVVSDSPYSNILTMMAIALASFLILNGISYAFFTGQFNVSFPKVFDTLFTGFLGFLGGFLIWSFLSLVIFITPLSQNTFVKEIGFKEEYRQTSISYISRFCNLINVVVSSQDNRYTTEQTIGELLKRAESKTPDKQAESEEGVEPAEPNEVETDIEEQFGPPPEVNIGGI